MQLPMRQTCSSGQTRLHWPQLLRLFCRFTHWRRGGQITWPSGQAPAQLPAMQRPDAQTFRHSPQLLGSLRRFTHMFPHMVWLSGHGDWQAPLRQTWAMPHEVPSATGPHCHIEAALQVRQAPVQRSAQQRPFRHEPDWHSMLSPHVAPGPFFVQAPPWQVLPLPQSVPLGRFMHVQFVAAVHARQAPAQGPAQQRPPTQLFDWHSGPLAQVSPLPFLAGGTQRFIAHI
jgi:hypothetical protein